MEEIHKRFGLFMDHFIEFITQENMIYKENNSYKGNDTKHVKVKVSNNSKLIQLLASYFL